MAAGLSRARKGLFSRVVPGAQTLPLVCPRAQQGGHLGPMTLRWEGRGGVPRRANNPRPRVEGAQERDERGRVRGGSVEARGSALNRHAFTVFKGCSLLEVKSP